MRLGEIRVEDVLSAKNWIVDAAEGQDALQSPVTETMEFDPSNTGLFSAVVKFGDGSLHPGLVVKSFARGGDEVDLFVHTKFGWMNLQTGGFMRAVGKYSHEIFPFEYYVGSPWKAGRRPTADPDSPHRKIFSDLISRLQKPKKETTRQFPRGRI